MPDAREIVDRFFSIRLGVSVADLKPGQVAVATCERRTFAERGDGFVRLMWALHFGDRGAMSVHPAALAEVSRLAWGLTPDDVLTEGFLDRAHAAFQAALPAATLNVGGTGVKLYHPGAAAPVHAEGEVRVLTPYGQARWAGERVYTYDVGHPSVARGEAFGLFLGDRLVAEVITHESSVAEMAHLIAEDGIEVAEEYRARGYGKALFAAWTRDMQARGRVCVHGTAADNTASIALAHSVGYLDYAHQRSVTFSPPDQPT